MKFFITLLLVIGAVFSFRVAAIWDAEIRSWSYVVEKGMTLSSVPGVFRADVDADSTAFRVWLKFFAPSVTLKQGTYVVTSDTTLSDLFTRELKKPSFEDREVTILPGWNIYDIQSYFVSLWLARASIVTSPDDETWKTLVRDYPFLQNRNSLEGYLLPDTYRIALDGTSLDAVRSALDGFKRQIWDAYPVVREKKGYELMIFASILEREERNPENKPVVSGILQKRLKEGIALGADATVCYPYQKTQKECTPSFIAEVIYGKSDYNTRTKLWLPPTPISNFSKGTFQDAYRPISSDYYYYLHDNKGAIHYGKTLQDHNANKAKYLR